MTVQITLTDEQVQSVLSQDGTVVTLQAKVTQLQTQLDAANAAIAPLQSQVTTLQGKINAAKAAAQADKDADAANVAGQGVLDALA